jgi:hypothetical protein
MRKIMRNMLRKKYGNKGLSSVWRGLQINKYGKEHLAILHKLCNPNTSTVVHKGRLLRALNKHRSE